MTVVDKGRTDFRKGLSWGLVAGLILGFPTGVALKAAGYPNDELYLWLAVLGAAYIVVLVAALLIALRRRALAGGLAIGSTIAIAPILVVLDIGRHSE